MQLSMIMMMLGLSIGIGTEIMIGHMIGASGAMLLWISLLLEPGRTFNLVVINSLRATGDARSPVLMGVWEKHAREVHAHVSAPAQAA